MISRKEGTVIFEFLKRLFGIKEQPAAPSDEHIPEGTSFLRISYATNKGLVRETNEDSFFIDGRCRHTFGKEEQDCYIELTGGTHVFGIFDGMGGEAHGEAASALSAVALERAFDSLTAAAPYELKALIDDFCRSANGAILDMLRDRGASSGGSTFAAVCVGDGTARTYYLGDSRVYIRGADGGLSPLTRDHTAAVAKLDAGLYTEEQARTSRDRHALTHFLGEDRSHRGLTSAECEAVTFGEGCALVMCTDGLTDMVTDDEIAAALTESSNSPASALVSLALDHGGKDNVTCIVIENLKKTRTNT